MKYMKYKVYILYHVEENELYGYTINLDFVNQFLDERNPDCFLLKEKKMDKLEFSKFTNKYRRELLCKFPYEAKDGTVVELIATYKEDEMLTHKIEEIEANVERIEKTIRDSKMKKKYGKLLDRLIRIDDGKGNLILDTLSIFIDLHKRTFIEPNEIIPKDELSLWDSQSDNSWNDVLEYF